MEECEMVSKRKEEAQAQAAQEEQQEEQGEEEEKEEQGEEEEKEEQGEEEKKRSRRSVRDGQQAEGGSPSAGAATCH